MSIIANKKILVIDDDKALCRSLEIGLSRHGAEIFTANNGQVGMQKFYDDRPDLVLLDIRMPELDGWETQRMIKMVADTPIIMLTSLSQDHEIVRGLRRGADDYVTKPFSHDVLTARIETALRRYDQVDMQSAEQDDTYDDGFLHIDLESRLVKREGEYIKLSAIEFRLLTYLFENAGKRLSFESILTEVWGWGYEGNPQYVHVYISNLRKKLEPDVRNPRYFISEHGYGYGFHKY